MFRKNEKGVTLVELLAVLVLVSMVATITFTTLSIATKYNITETKKLKMQQEANYIITKVLQEHRAIKDKKSCYNLNVVDEGKQIVLSILMDCTNPNSPKKEIIIADTFLYELTGPADEIYPKEESFKTTLTVKDPKGPKDPTKPRLSVSIDTEFKRYTN